MDIPQQIKDDFGKFLTILWKSKGLPAPTALQLSMANYLQHGSRYRMIQAFRGAAKTYITCAYVCWRLMNDNNLNVLIVAAGDKYAKNIIAEIKSQMSATPFTQHLVPTYENIPAAYRNLCRDNALEFDVATVHPGKDPSIRANGIKSNLTGGRADLIIGDDVESRNNSDTVVKREQIRTNTQEFSDILKPDGEIVYLGTPQTEDSIYNELPDRGYTVRIWPARYPDKNRVEKMGDSLSHYLRKQIDKDPSLMTSGIGGCGKTTEPTRFTDAELQMREADKGRASFELQFMLNTTLSDKERYPLKLRDLIVMDCDTHRAPFDIQWTSRHDHQIKDVPNVGRDGDRMYEPMMLNNDWHSYSGKVMFIDPAGSGKDKTGVTITGYLNGRIYLLYAKGFDGGANEETLSAIAQAAAQHKVTMVRVESNFGDGMWTSIFKPILYSYHKCGIEDVRHTKQKELRVCDTLEPIMNQHRLVVDKKIIISDYENNRGQNGYEHQLFFQMTRMARIRGALKHDDLIDSLAGNVAYWVEHMAISQQQARSRVERQIRETKNKKELAVFGVKSPEKSKRISKRYFKNR